MEKITSLCKRRGFIFQNSEIYGGLGSIWDYGPLGVELKNNVKRAWWKSMIYNRDDVEGLDSSILMHPNAWMASGHVTSFQDLMVDCKDCKKRFREDLLKEKKCPECGGALTEPKKFNLMFKTFIGSVEDKSAEIYLRPETAQGIFVNFSNVLMSSRKKLPFGIAQIGKSFRNEITTGNFVFRCREFEQMELEYFTKPEEADKWYKYWLEQRLNWYINLGIDSKDLRLREHAKDELAHYAKSCHDIEYLFPMGWSELEGIANRGDFDLKQHSKLSGKDLVFFDDESKANITPYIIEPSGGVDRAVLAFLLNSYREEEVKGEKRVLLALHKDLVPIKVAVLPLLRNRPQIVELAHNIVNNLRADYKVSYDDTASIGRLYRRQDEIGTLYCVTVDVDSLEDKKVTIRYRDTMKQDRIEIENLKKFIEDKLR
ncbi:MAG: glycine--tRNA ligase [Candidatus Omnitrophica bacterium CG07_land_8_20_14_0_80_42_15]|uniref:Glycine--tRNA ligase n=1 Tax=Candidatus Aquitaenariimonas noxiae TaxID=1974741 RepID=A0A2J0KXG9_9BACT|nr:MAG: glycine--tRNA ligase [Candidatus Omnitrophica bacterium CG07_land_8_20_14_0_80_42_15]